MSKGLTDLVTSSCVGILKLQGRVSLQGELCFQSDELLNLTLLRDGIGLEKLPQSQQILIYPQKPYLISSGTAAVIERKNMLKIASSRMF